MQALVLADAPSVHDTLGVVLREAFPGIVVHSQTRLEAAVAHVRRTARMNLVVVELPLPGSRGLEALTHLRDKLPPCRIVVLSARHERALILAALRSGAAGYLPKGCAPKLMGAALRLVAAGGIYLPPEVLPRQVRVPVSPRQRDVLRLLMKRYSNRRIACELAMPEGTVAQHMRELFDAVGVSSRAQLVAALRTSSTR